MMCATSRPLSPRADRLPHLDALRGIAALVVVLHHALQALPAGDPLVAAVHRLGVLRIVELGRPAVILFFVLSGFVLTLCLEPCRDGLAAFAARRAIRLLPSYWAATVLALLLYATSGGLDPAAWSSWFADQWSAPVSPGDVARHLGMLAGPRQYPLDHVAWSLVHELRLSLVVPLLLLVAARCGTLAGLGLAAVASLGAGALVAADPALFPTGLHGFRFDAEGLAASCVLTARFMLPFALGAALATHRGATTAIVARHGWLGTVGLLGGLILCSLPDEAMMTLGAGLLVALVAASTRCARMLDVAPLAWLGRTSYSLYLVHLPVMLACGRCLGGSPKLALCIAVVLAFGLAELMFRLVEAPSIRWSRVAARALSRRAPVVTAPLPRIA